MASTSATRRAIHQIAVVLLMLATFASSMTTTERHQMRDKVKEMFNHGYMSYMKYAYPADELMPLSCKGRFRGSEVDRGDIDEVLGNYSLTLVDTMDTLAVLGEVDEFEHAVKLVADNVQFDTDAVVSVFEANIRVLGGLLGGHVMAEVFKAKGNVLQWYSNELLSKAVDLADRLLAAFNTSTGIPYPKVNLRYGVHHPSSRLGTEQDTCTACAGTMIMEFGALSRLTGNPVYEDKARKAMEAIWSYRSHHSDLVGTVINIHNGNWIRRDSGVGAGIDSYYEYCFKAYVLLGDESYLEKFNKHYAAVKKYLHHGVMWLDVLMHQPERPVRMFMDALQAFWPGLQVMLGDLKPAIETHHMLYEVAKKHKFLPEAFTTNLEVYWGQHPLRPEFAESTYFLYEATQDPHYLEVGKHIVQSLEDYARVPCGYAAVKDVRTLSKEDKMDSFVLAETFKYLYLLFSDENERQIDIHDYVFTTEAHLLPLSLSNVQRTRENSSSSQNNAVWPEQNKTSSMLPENDVNSACPNSLLSQGSLISYAETIRREVKLNDPTSSCSRASTPVAAHLPIVGTVVTSQAKLRAEDFQFANEEHMQILKEMGINAMVLDGRVQLMHQAGQAVSLEQAQHGIKFMQDMIVLTKEKAGQSATESVPRVVQVLSHPHNGNVVFSAGPASFGLDLSKSVVGVATRLFEAVPLHGCTDLQNPIVQNSILLMERGECMFIDKVRIAQSQGAIGVIIVDTGSESSSDTQQAFSMSGDDHSDDVKIPSVFLFAKEGRLLRQYLAQANSNGEMLEVRLAAKAFFQGASPAGSTPSSPGSEPYDSSATKVSDAPGSASGTENTVSESIKGCSPPSPTADVSSLDKAPAAAANAKGSGVFLVGFTDEVFVPDGPQWEGFPKPTEQVTGKLQGQWTFDSSTKATANGKLPNPHGGLADTDTSGKEPNSDAIKETPEDIQQSHGSSHHAPAPEQVETTTKASVDKKCVSGDCFSKQEALEAIDKSTAEDLSRRSATRTQESNLSRNDNSKEILSTSQP